MSLRLRLLLATGAASLLALVAMDVVTYTRFAVICSGRSTSSSS